MRENRSLLSALGLGSTDRDRVPPTAARTDTDNVVLARLEQIELRLSAIEASLATLLAASDRPTTKTERTAP